MYYEYLLCYVGDVLCISDDPMRTMKGIQAKFKLKGYKIEEPNIYVVSELSKMTNVYGQECWAMYSDNYCTPSVTNVEYVFVKACFKVSEKVCYPSDLWLPYRYGCDRIDQDRWIKMVPRIHWYYEVSSVNW